MLAQNALEQFDRVIELEFGLLNNAQALQRFGIIGIGGKHLPVDAFCRGVVLLALIDLRSLEQVRRLFLLRQASRGHVCEPSRQSNYRHQQKARPRPCKRTRVCVHFRLRGAAFVKSMRMSDFIYQPAGCHGGSGTLLSARQYREGNLPPQSPPAWLRPISAPEPPKKIRAVAQREHPMMSRRQGRRPDFR